MPVSVGALFGGWSSACFRVAPGHFVYAYAFSSLVSTFMEKEDPCTSLSDLFLYASCIHKNKESRAQMPAFKARNDSLVMDYTYSPHLAPVPH